MRKVHTADSAVTIAHLRNVLESEGIACIVRNEQLSGVTGEVPFLECWPELWVRDAGQAFRAERLIEEALRPRWGGDAWTCSRCGERIEAQFTECWNCAGPPESGVAGS